MDSSTSLVDSHGVPYSVRIKKMREAVGKSSEQVASQVGVPFLTYRDWESGEGDITITASLAEVARLASVLGVSSAEIFESVPSSGDKLAPDRLCDEIKMYLKRTGKRVKEFEDQVGFEISPALESSARVMDWNLDCLRFVCKELGINWLLALPR